MDMPLKIILIVILSVTAFLIFLAIFYPSALGISGFLDATGCDAACSFKEGPLRDWWVGSKQCGCG